MKHYLVSLDTINFLKQNPDSVWVSPERDYIVVVLEGIIQVWVDDFSEVKGSDALNAHIRERLSV